MYVCLLHNNFKDEPLSLLIAKNEDNGMKFKIHNIYGERIKPET